MRRLLLIAVLGCACAHAKSVEQQGKPPPETTEPTQPGQPPLSSSPKGILEPGAVRKIQKALEEKGYGIAANGVLEGPTETQLQAFQKKEHLPETGLPDQETLRKLGLNPEDIYRSNPK